MFFCSTYVAYAMHWYCTFRYDLILLSLAEKQMPCGCVAVEESSQVEWVESKDTCRSPNSPTNDILC